MIVAQQIVIACDLCGSTKEVNQVTVQWDGHKWQLDICPKCYKSRFSDLEAVGRKPTRRRRQTFTVVKPVEPS